MLKNDYSKMDSFRHIKCGKEWFLPRQESSLQALKTNLYRTVVQE